MKKIVSLFFILALFLCVLSGCDDSVSSSEETYSLETGAISEETFNTAMDRIQNTLIPNYNEVSSVRDYLYQNTLSNYQTQAGVSWDELESFMTSRGFTSKQITTEKNFLKKTGNDILFFEHALEKNKRIWMYITK
jgi:hypothetical protein